MHQNSIDVMAMLSSQYSKYLELAQRCQDEIDAYEDERLELIHECESLFRQAMRERLLSKALDRRRRHEILLNDPNPYPPEPLRTLQGNWQSLFSENIRFFLDNWHNSAHEIKTRILTTDEEFEEVQQEFYVINGLAKQAERDMLKCRNNFAAIVEGYRSQMLKLHDGMLKVIQGYRSRHYYYLENLEKRESERHV